MGKCPTTGRWERPAGEPLSKSPAALRRTLPSGRRITMEDTRVKRITETITAHPDFPKPGILFRDIFSVLAEPSVFRDLTDVLTERARAARPAPDVVVGLESRGFLFGTPLALALKIPFVPVRKKGKLPGELKQVSFTLEYGSDVFEAQVGNIKAGQKVLIVDDLLATGGSMKAACDLVTSMGATVSLCLVCIELGDLKGKEKLRHPFDTIVKY
ncbi:Adenine phosphoribosyltransferase [Chionoecetes opilio]|uniref:Adenine phosphoribosyltransferase n=1 Tax=Chionoecetes opilio TaxID=41210 RepID=A0A8J4XSL5_CHIOP|nr:Adenine phosphoribosyltransferase [Chionoecetes opilio]